MRQKVSLLNFVGVFLLASFFAKSSLGCGGMTFPSSLLCGSTAAGGYTTGYPTLTASLVYVPTSLLGGYSQPISYPPNPLAPKSPTTTATSSYPYYYNAYPSYGYGTGYPSYGYGMGYPSYGYGNGYGYPTYGLTGGGLGLLGGLGGLGSCGSGSALFPSQGLTSGGLFGGLGYGSYPIGNAGPTVVTVLAPSTHGCSTNSGAFPVYSIPRPVCSQFCGIARNLVRPISRGHISTSNRLY